MINQPGVLEDTRAESEKANDIQFSELVTSIAPPVWKEKPQGEWRHFPIFDQNGSGSCVAQTLRKIMGVYIWLKTGVFVALSASHIYQRRANKPSAGMGGTDAFEIGKKGVTLEQFAPSEKMTDLQMDNVQVLSFMQEVGNVFKLGEYVVDPVKDIDTIASIIQSTGKAVMVWFYFQFDEWDNVPKIINPNLDRYNPSTIRHSLAAVDFTLHNGEKALIVDESWGKDTAMNGQRVITESFFKKRNFFAAHFMNFKFEEGTTKPQYNFTKDLEFGMSDPDVKALQGILKFEGLFPTNIESTSYFGNVTRQGVLKFQTKYGIDQAGRVGPLTRSKLNMLYN